MADFDRAIERSPGYAWAYFNRAQERLALGDSPAARADFARALELEPQGSTAPWVAKAREALQELAPR